MAGLDPAGIAPTQDGVTPEELALATRNRGLPLEMLRHDITPAGLHYLLIHYDIPDVDAARWRLRVGGAVEAPMSLSLDELQAMPSKTFTVTMECAGNGRALLSPRPVSQPWGVEAIGTARWTGVPLRDLLHIANPLHEAVELVFTGADHGTERGVEQDYQRSLTIKQASAPEVLLAYAMNDQPIPPQHGHPMRLVVPGWYGMASVKWLTHIEAVTTPFDGYQQRAYSFRRDEDDPGTPVTTIAVRSLMIPPGFPDFLTRRRIVDAGPVPLRGRAWAGATPITRVEVAADGGWFDATLDEPVGDFAWRGWSATWTAQPGDHVLQCRATDANGVTQPLDQPWNYGGFANNLVHTLRVTVR